MMYIKINIDGLWMDAKIIHVSFKSIGGDEIRF